MSDELPPLPSDIRDLIARDRRDEIMPEDARRRLLRNVGAAVLAGGAATVAVKGGLLTGVYAFFTRKGAIAAMAFTLGGAAGASGYAVAQKMSPVAPSAPTCPSVAASPPPPPRDAPKPLAPPVEPMPSVSASAPSVVASPPPPPSVSSTKSDLESEKTLIETAQSALLHGNAQKALDATLEHKKRFPAGQLGEEREFHAIRALHLLGRADEANARFDAFRARYPKSLYTEPLNKVLGKQ